MDQSHKRTHSKVESDPALEKDSEAKRPSRDASDHPSGQPAPPSDSAVRTYKTCPPSTMLELTSLSLSLRSRQMMC